MTLSYHNSRATKDKFVARARAHYAADEIISGKYWENGKGCAVGCLSHGSSHEQLAEELGIPIQMTYLIDTLFEGTYRVDSAYAKHLPVRFVEAIPVGVDLQRILDRWFLALLSDPTHGAINYADNETSHSVQSVIDLYARKLDGHEPSSEEWDAAGAAAWAAAWGAWGAARAAEAAARGARAAAGAAHYIWQADTLLRLLQEAQ